MRATVRRSFLGIALTVVGVGGIAIAQQDAARPPAEDHLYTSAADIQSLIAKAKTDAKPGQPVTPEPILRLTRGSNGQNPYNATLEYRAAVGPAAVHIHEAEIFYVIDGSCTMTTGGKLTEAKPTNAENLTGTGIEGGASRTLAKGDFMVVPENTPHWVSAINGTVVFMTLHVPRPDGGVATSSAAKP